MASLPIPLIASARIIKGSSAPRALAEYIHEHFGKLLLVTGAGCSVDSGIPCSTGMTCELTPLQEFKPVGNASYQALETQRQRVWARFIYSYFLNYLPAKPNKVHFTLNELAHQNAFHGHVTLNVDGLFQKAGLKSDRFVELCDNFLDNVYCYECNHEMDGMDHLSHILALNPFHAEHVKELSITADLSDADSLQSTVVPPQTINGEAVVTNRMPIKFFNLVPCPGCGSKKFMPGQALNHSTGSYKERRNLLNQLCGRAPLDAVIEPLTERQMLLPEEEQEKILEEKKAEMATKTDPPAAVLVLGSALTRVDATAFLKRHSLRNLPLAVLDINPSSEWLLHKEPELVFEAPIQPTLEAAKSILADLRSSK